MHDIFDFSSHTKRPHEASRKKTPPKTLVLLGTRPEAIKLAPVIHRLKENNFPTIVVSSSQHKDLLKPFFRDLDISPDHDLDAMSADQTPNEICSRILSGLDKILDDEKPDAILVQGDTTTTLAGAIAGFNRRIPVGHVEAGLRSGDSQSPFPEEMNRTLVSRVASVHFAATEKNRQNLLREGIPTERVFITGNTVVDALQYILNNVSSNKETGALIERTSGLKRILLTTHRRESFGRAMAENLKVLRDFVRDKKDVCLIFPVHPNPNVRNAALDILSGIERVHLLDPLDYADFVSLMKNSWLIVSDSGGVQEEAPSLGKPLFVLRENTERPEAVESGIARLTGGDPRRLRQMLEENHAIDTWIDSVSEIMNPFGDGRAAEKIVDILERELVSGPGAVRSS